MLTIICLAVAGNSSPATVDLHRLERERTQIFAKTHSLPDSGYIWGSEGSGWASFFEVGRASPIYYISETAQSYYSPTSLEVTVTRWDWRSGKKPRRAWKLVFSSGRDQRMLGGTLWNLALNGGDVEMDESLREIKMHPKDHFGFHLTAHVGDWQMTKRDLFAARPMVRYRFGMHGDIAAPGFQMQVIGGDLALLGYGSTGLASQPTPNGTEFFTDKTPFIVIDPEAKLLRTLEKSTHRRQ